ncbi:type II toxin-antitoxin system PemK/MazF family toxin [Bacillus altitudinis]|uniref:type II toxin-antitoxin system PemK/MazF family toxin n=1 Tax=Bacillus altitudinis TaxID=293387 RepID=UPI002F94387F
MSDFILKNSWTSIERGTEYLAAFTFHAKRPLSFFYPDSQDPEKGIITNSVGDFSPEQQNDGTFKGRVQHIVVPLKPRNVVVITSDEINKSQNYEYILVAPIYTIKTAERNKDWYSILRDDEHPIYTYLPGKNGLERYADLSQTTSIHKSLLLKKLVTIEEERWEVLEENLLHCLSLGIIDEDVEDADV